MRWMTVLVVFSLGYVFDGLVLGWIKHRLDFPRAGHVESLLLVLLVRYLVTRAFDRQIGNKA